MGFYDGLAGTAEASTHALAQASDTPVILVADCGGKALSLAAELQGYVRFLPNNIAGLVLNRASPRSFPMLKRLVEQHCGFPVLGYLPRIGGATLEGRHLGLVTPAEVADLRQRVDLLARQLIETVDLDGILTLAATAPALVAPPPKPQPLVRVRIAVAQDEAFCFHYPDSLALLEALGAELVPFSPLHNTALPQDIHGLLLGGGYPEFHAPALARNPLLGQIRSAVEDGLPTIAECGGFLLLCKSLTTSEGSFPMAGVIGTDGAMTTRLGRFGYVTLTARTDSLLCGKGEQLRAHEFHYSQVSDLGGGFRAEKADGSAWNCVHTTPTLYAGYPHLYFGGNEMAARRFLLACAARKEIHV